MSTTLSGYRLLRKRDFSQEPSKDEEDATVGPSRTCRSLRVAFNRLYFVAIHCCIFLAIFFWLQNHKRLKHLRTRILPSELQFAQDVIKYEEITFDPSGFWDDESQHTAFEGGVSPAIDEAWRSLTSVGLLSLTQEEYDATNLTTIPVPGKSDRYLVTIEMFHQIHCLNYLRQRLHGTASLELSKHGDAAHLDHCIDYLRQVIMCHGDLTPITLTWSQEMEWIKPNFNIRHTCRKFQSIWDFALSRNTSGLMIE